MNLMEKEEEYLRKELHLLVCIPFHDKTVHILYHIKIFPNKIKDQITCWSVVCRCLHMSDTVDIEPSYPLVSEAQTWEALVA